MRILAGITPRGPHAFAPEVRLLRGPKTIGVPGQSTYDDLLGSLWVFVIDIKRGDLFLLQPLNASGDPIPPGSVAQPTSWRTVELEFIPHPASAMRHAVTCFDQAARPVVAYELDERIYVVQWDAFAQRFVTRGPFPGVDPVLIWDFEVGRYLPDSDVILLHLSQDRRSLIMRVQRENYAVERVQVSLEDRLYLDQAVALPFRGQVLGSLEIGQTKTSFVALTSWYPYPSRATLTLEGKFNEGLYRQTSFIYHHTMGMGLSGVFSGGSYDETTIRYMHSMGLLLQGVLTSGEYREIVKRYQPAPVGLYIAGQFSSGAYTLIAVNYGHPPMGLSLQGQFVGGTYA